MFMVKISENVCNQEAVVSGGNGEEKTVDAVHCAAVTGDEIAVILNAGHTLEKGSGKVAHLTERGTDKCGEHAAYGVYILEEEADNQAGYDCGDCTADAAFDCFVGAYFGSKLMLTESLAAEKSKAVANPGGNAGKSENGKPLIQKSKLGDNQNGDDRVHENGKRCKSTGAANLFAHYACGHDCEYGDEYDYLKSNVVGGFLDIFKLIKVDKGNCACAEEIDNPGGTVDILCLDYAAGFANGENCDREEKQSAGYA